MSPAGDLGLGESTRASATRFLIELPNLNTAEQAGLLFALLQVAYAEGAHDSLSLFDAGTKAAHAINAAKVSA